MNNQELIDFCDQLTRESDEAYAEYCRMATQNSLCLGHAIKMKQGKFTEAELDAHKKLSALYSKHLTIYQIQKALRQKMGYEKQHFN